MWAQTRRSSCARLTALHPLLLMLLGACLGHSLDDGAVHPTSQLRPFSKVEPYEATEPWLLIEGQRRPISLLKTMGHPASLKLLIEAEGEQLLLILQKNEGLFASHYSETHYLEGGKAVTSSSSSTVNCYYHGQVKGYQHSDVILSTCTGFRGLITFKDKVLVLEPAQKPNSTIHHIYRGEHLNLTRGTCGHGHNISHTAGVPDSLGTLFSSHSTRHKRHAQSNTKYVELIIVADNREYQKQGKDVEKVKQRLAEIANYVDKFYRALNIRVALVGLEVWSDSDKCPVTQDPFTTLHEFLDWRKLKLLPQRPHDNAQLISGVYFQGTTIGMAPIMSMCTAEQSGGIVMDHSDNPLGAAVTLAHELGHNFGMNHDTPERGCGCRVTADRGGCIMTPSTGYPFPTVFSSCSKKDLLVSLEKGVGMCLFNMPEVKVLYGGQKCGNGYVEEGEECDCGDLEECMNPCCNASTCTLKGNAVCAHGQCCEDCQLKPAGTPCRESSNSCDLPEFCTGSDPHCPANVYLHDGHACHSVDGHCYNGICQTHEQQCITLWGQGAKPAPGICFERVNSAGDPYGNCGKDSKGSFAKCEEQDAKCGKIQCQGGANRPVIGTNAVSIETNIPLQEGGRILCRGTHVYLGDDMPDPGLVLTGTKCGEDMMCLNRQCQNVSVFGVHECSAKCSGRGVCNNKKNCHCEAHWAPPFCDKAGFGGSVDSGPVRLADSESVKVGIVVAFLCLLCVGMIVCIKRKTLAGLFINNKKNTIEKLRSVGPNRSASPGHTFPASQTHAGAHKHSACRASPQCQAPAIPQSASIYKPQSPLPGVDSVVGSVSLRRLPQCPPLHLSHPLPFTLSPSPPAPPPHRAPPPPLPHSHSHSHTHAYTNSPSHRAPPAHPHAHTHSHTHSPPRGASLRGLSCQNTCRMAMLEKPRPPQKPLPADPMGRTVRLMRSPSAIRLPAPIPTSTTPRSAPSLLTQPNRPPLKQPPTLPKPQFLTGMPKPSS
ncbi:disintegrin and metalloproteinase domain-containing protein 12 isoform X2 [Salminus brasiliensis]|uniref:disintegrin and metalloproteinase domain-containing protein 12 isoform X2 n=1 Tax=Salminus brasiliensis TaxID=930266 RepID=UPI003B837C96